VQKENIQLASENDFQVIAQLKAEQIANWRIERPVDTQRRILLSLNDQVGMLHEQARQDLTHAHDPRPAS